MKELREVWISLASSHQNLPGACEGMRDTKHRKIYLCLLPIDLGMTLALCAQFLKKSWQTQGGQRGILVKEGFGVKAP